MSRLRPTAPVTVAMTAFEIWRRLPPAQRQRVLRAARTHGPKVAAAILAARRRRLR
jgi:acyl-CoA reductase-like NAD-dependent aldehyde dehydrogenase